MLKRFNSRTWVPAAVAALLFGCATAPAPTRQPAPPVQAPPIAPAPAESKAPSPPAPAKPAAPAAATEGVPMRLNVDAEQRFAAALDLIRRERYEQAASLLNVMTRDYPDLIGPYLNLGIVYARLGRATDAEQAFNRVLERQPDNAIAYNQLGVLYREQGRFADARHAYERALEINNAYAEAHLNLGILFDLYLQEPGAALEHYERYRELAGDGQGTIEKWIADLKHRLASPPASQPERKDS